MASNQVLVPVSDLPNDNEKENGSTENIVYLSPAKFKMKLLKRLVSIEPKQELKTASVLKRTQSENGFQASIVLPNGEMGTIFSLDRTKRQMSRQSSQSDEVLENSNKLLLPNIHSESFGKDYSNSFGLQSPEPEYRRPLKLPPIMLPSVFSTKTYPIAKPDPSYRPPNGPITDEEWDELKDCRYLRPAPKKFKGRQIA